MRDEKKRRERKKLVQAKAETDAKLRAYADKIIAHAETLIEQGKWPGASEMAITHIAVIAKAIIRGEFIMQTVGGEIYCASEGLKSMAAALAASATGRDALVTLGKMTTDRPIDRKALPVAGHWPQRARLRAPGRLPSLGTPIYPAIAMVTSDDLTRWVART